MHPHPHRQRQRQRQLVLAFAVSLDLDWACERAKAVLEGREDAADARY